MLSALILSFFLAAVSAIQLPGTWGYLTANSTYQVEKLTRILVEWIDKTISNSYTLQIDLRGILNQVGADGGNIMPSKRFTKDEEVIVSKIRVRSEEVGQKVQHITSNLALIGHITSCLTNSAEACTTRLINIKQIVVLIPSILVGYDVVAGLVHLVRTILKEQSQLRGAARTSS